MKKPGRHPGGGSKHLSEEEDALWQHLARSLKPLRRKKGRVHGVEEVLEKPPSRKRVHAEEEPQRKPSENGAAGQSATARGHSKKAPPLADFDRNAARKIRSGQTEIEAKIDLHGMRQSEALAALRRFLLRSQSRGLRWVLVITGKGAPLRRDETFDDLLAAHERGVLRRNVPRWLSEPELRPVVVSFTTAAIQHGGEGALYVQIRAWRG
jgi:DNA-nicking Smr family endonuclease